MRRIAVCGVLFAVAFLQHPGKLVADTKLDLAVSPVAFLGRALSLWEPEGFAGQLQNQAYGYLFPIGPFFALGHLAQLPGWAVQRLWWGVVLCTAFLGARALAERLRIGTPATQLIAGLAYALSPRILSTLGPVSAEAWPMAVAPWILLPLVAASAGAPAARSALRSGVAVAFTGGVNAVLSFAAALPAFLYLLTRRMRGGGARMLLWWCGAAALATLWWVGPLFLLGAYSPPFLDYIESARNTTEPTWLVETLRGTDHWVAYLGPTFGSTWQAGLDLVRNPMLVLDTIVVAGLGLAGLAMRSMPERRWLCSVFVAGLLLVTFGHAGVLDGPFAHFQQGLLDGALAPMRNVHKYDPLIRLPLALGIAHVLPRVVWNRDPAMRRLTGLTSKAGALLAVALVAAPALSGRLAPSGSYTDLPDQWRQAAAWLDANATGRALLAPGSRFGTYVWGTTHDEPVQPLTKAAWEVRNAVPLVQPGHIRFLDTLEQRFASGRGSTGLASYLRRGGIEFVLVRNDLDYAAGRASRPALVRAVLEGSPGLRRVAAFGTVTPRQPNPGTVVDARLQGVTAAVEIWRVTGPKPAPVTLTPLDQVSRISGGPESLLDLADDNLLPVRPSILAGSDGSDLAQGPVIVTDGMRRREVDFGASLANRSATLTPADPLRLDRTQADYLPFTGLDHLTVGVWHGAADVQVSSSRSDAGVLGGSDPARQPAAAFDSDLRTAWEAAPADSVAPWVQVRMAQPKQTGDLTVDLLPESAEAVQAVVADVDGITTTIQVTGPRVRVPLPDVEWSTLRLELRVRPLAAQPIGIAEVGGLGIRYGLRVPTDPPADRAVDVFSFAAADGHSDGCVTTDAAVTCVPELVRAGEDDERIDRSFMTTRSGEFDLGIRAAPRAGPDLDRLIAVAARRPVTATASSVAVDTPMSSAAAAVDGRDGTGWTADPDDGTPSLTLRLRHPVRLDRIRLITGPGLPAARPNSVEVTAGGRAVRADLAEDGMVRFQARTTDRIVVTVPQQDRMASYDPTTGRTRWLPWGFSEVQIPALGTLASAGNVRVTLPCGQGPTANVDGTLYPTRVAMTVRQLESLHEVTVTPCGKGGSLVELDRGSHRLVIPATKTWRPVGAGLRADTAVDYGSDVLAEPRVLRWGRALRTVEVGERPLGALLVIDENANPGWRATLNGHRLRPLQVDGWQQAFAVPAGAGGIVRLEYTPSVPYRMALWIGGVALLGLILLAYVLVIDGESLPLRPARPRAPVKLAVVTVALGLLAGVAGVLVALAVAAARTALTKPPARYELDVPWAGASGLAITLAGCMLALRPWGSAHGYAAGTLLVQLLSLVTIALVAVPTVGRPRARAAVVQASPRPGTAATPPGRSDPS
jgi:arabinofuranan 3-O-arabinosyltransferase